MHRKTPKFFTNVMHLHRSTQARLRAKGGKTREPPLTDTDSVADANQVEQWTSCVLTISLLLLARYFLVI